MSSTHSSVLLTLFLQEMYLRLYHWESRWLDKCHVLSGGSNKYYHHIFKIERPQKNFSSYRQSTVCLRLAAPSPTTILFSLTFWHQERHRWELQKNGFKLFLHSFGTSPKALFQQEGTRPYFILYRAKTWINISKGVRLVGSSGSMATTFLTPKLLLLLSLELYQRLCTH